MNEILENQTVTKRHRKIFFLLRRFKKSFSGLGYGFAAFLFLLGVAFGMARTPLFSLQNIEIIGDFKNISQGEVKSLVPVSAGTNLFQIPLKEVEKKISQLKWARSVSVRRQVPHTLWIAVQEYKPKAILLADKLYFVSEEGKVFKEVEREGSVTQGSVTQGTRDLPVLTGFRKEDSLEDVLSLIDFFESKPDFSLFGLSEIHYNDATGFSIVTLSGPMEIKLGRDNFEKKLNRFRTAWLHLKSKVGSIRGIDLDYEDQAFVKL